MFNALVNKEVNGMNRTPMVPMIEVLAEVLDESLKLSLEEIAALCGVKRRVIIEMVQLGIIEPQGKGTRNWCFSGHDLVRIRQTLRLQRDLDISLPGAALVMDLLDELNELRAIINRNHNRR